MDSLKIYTQDDILAMVKPRNGEEKLGQLVQVVDGLDDLVHSTARFVILGIPEDVGVRANFGIGGTKTAFHAAMKAFLNIQSNTFLKGDEILLLGHFQIDEPEDMSVKGLRSKTAAIDDLVAPVVQKIIECGKVPIIIGGGHNNALPIISGASAAMEKPVNVVNIDAHADLRNVAEGRHSGNGFSNALAQKKLAQYFLFGLHENYLHRDVPTQYATSDIKAIFFEEVLRSRLPVAEIWSEFVKDLADPCGLEIDLDSIENCLSSAATPSGFALNDIRKMIMANAKDWRYLHICEGAAQLADGRIDLQIGKSIAYLISDAIKVLLLRSVQQP